MKALCHDLRHDVRWNDPSYFKYSMWCGVQWLTSWRDLLIHPLSYQNRLDWSTNGTVRTTRLWCNRGIILQSRHKIVMASQNHLQLNSLFIGLLKLTTKEHQTSALPVLCEGNPRANTDAKLSIANIVWKRLFYTSECEIDIIVHSDGLVQECSNSIANALELLQSCAKTSI